MNDDLDQSIPVGAYVASALMAANYGGDSGEDVDRFLDELLKRGYVVVPAATHVGGHPEIPWHPYEPTGTGQCAACIRAEARAEALREAREAVKDPASRCILDELALTPSPAPDPE